MWKNNYFSAFISHQKHKRTFKFLFFAKERERKKTIFAETFPPISIKYSFSFDPFKKPKENIFLPAFQSIKFPTWKLTKWARTIFLMLETTASQEWMYLAYFKAWNILVCLYKNRSCFFNKCRAALCMPLQLYIKLKHEMHQKINNF